MYRGMRVPVIMVKDSLNKKAKPRMLGTDSHDWLYIDKETKGIHYLNLQCCEGTKYGSYEFVGNEPDGEFTTESWIEWWTIDKLIEFAKQKDAEQEKLQKDLEEMFGKDVIIID